MPRPGIIEGSTHCLGAPQNWDQDQNGRCAALHIRSELIQGVPFMRSAWEMDSGEIGAALAGGKLVLGIGGSTHPVVHMAMSAVPDDAEPVVIARRFTAPTGQQAMRVEMVFGGGKRGFCEVQINDGRMSDAVQIGVDKVMELATNEGWLA